jgi:hypothetical protein
MAPMHFHKRPFTAASAPSTALISSLVYSPNIGGSNTTGAINTTGASLIVVLAGSYHSWQATSVTDSKGNTYTPLTDQNDGTNDSRFFYCLSPTVGSGHTFTPNFGNTIDTFVGVLAFSGITAFHTQNGAVVNNNTNPLQPGAVVPAVNGSVIVTGISNYSSVGATTINSGFTAFTYNGSANNALGGIAYLIQSTAASVNPTWSIPTSLASYPLVIADFHP